SMQRRTHRNAIALLMHRLATRYDVRVYQYANAGNHLHLLLRAPRRESLRAFLRAFAGLVARAVTGARKGAPSGRFWAWTAYSRLLTWGREFSAVRRYVFYNEIEGDGALSPRKLEVLRKHGGWIFEPELDAPP